MFNTDWTLVHPFSGGGRTKGKADARTDKEEIPIFQPVVPSIQSSKTAESTQISRITPLLIPLGSRYATPSSAGIRSRAAITPLLLLPEEIHRNASTPSSTTTFIPILLIPAEEYRKISTPSSIGIHSTSSEPIAQLKDAASSSVVGSGTSSIGILSPPSIDPTETARLRGAETISAPRIHKKEVQKQDQPLHHRGAILGAQIPEKEVTGGEEVKKEIINQLLHHRGALLGALPTITILGIRGVGKTKLSKLIVDDEEVNGNFYLIWLPVGDHFDVNHLVKCIVESSVNFRDEPEGDDIQILPEKQGKRSYLVVLHDLRNLDKDQWDSFQRKLTEAAGTSTGVILITTPYYIVAKIASSITLYTFKGLKEDDSWSLFEKIALFDEQGRRLNDSRISDYGRKLISKCRGIPLATKIMAKLLSSLVPEVTETEQAQSEREVLENLMSKYYDELRSEYYNDLSSLAKDCFAYCSLFPKNYLIDVQELIDLWMAEEFLVATHPGASPEDVRHNYLREFLHRSIFQDVKYDELGMVRTCRMNPLMHDLATFIGREENASVDRKGYIVPGRVLRVSFDFVSEISFGIPKSLLLKAQRLRTILLPASTPCRLPHEVKLTKFQCGAIFSCFKNLGVLDLHDLGIEALPRSIGELKNLKCLDLSRNNIDKLPSSITKLVHLQTLKLSHCHHLKKLPKNLQSLANLRHLRIDGCLALTHMPRGIRKLTSLQSLSYFVASNDFNSSCCSDKGGLSELSYLSKLAGGIEILHLERLKYDGLEARNQNLCLKAKPHLHRLTLRWDHDQDNGSGWRQEDEENRWQLLQPDSNLKVLFIVGYNGLKISRWLSSLKNLVKFSLYNCSKCQFLPPLDQLPSLKILELKRLESLEFIGEKPSTSATIPRQFFTSLRELALTSCPKLTAWWKLGAEASFPCISRLQIRYCPNLISIPLFPHLDEKLELVCCSMEPLMKTITLQTNAVASQSSLPLSKLKSMLIEKALTSSTAGEWLTNFTSLEDLHIGDCPNLTQLPRGFNDLCSLKSLTVENCPGLDMSSDEWNGLKNLNTLTVRRIPKLLSLPEGLGCATSVQHLELHGCSGLTSLSDEIGKLTSLKSLVISECYNLASLPKEMKNLKSLEKLVIRDCPKLLPRCQPETGNDWPYIKHIGIPKISVTQTPRELNLIGNLGK